MEKPLKVCLVTQQLGNVLSGIGHIARNMLARLLHDRHEVTVIAPVDQKPSSDLAFRFMGVPKPLGANSQARWISLSWSFRRALKTLPQREFDLVYFTDAREALFSTHFSPVIGMVNDTYAAELNSLEYYRRHYSDWSGRWVYYTLIRQIERFTYPRMDALVTNSQHTARMLQKIYRLPGEKIHTCYCGIDKREYTLPGNPPTQTLKPRILFVGGNMQRKGLPALIAAAPAILAAFPLAEFWVIGRDRVETRMKELCQELGVSQQFRFLGHQPNEKIPDFLENSTVFVMPSLIEAFGIVFLEAMAAGVPVIGTRVGGIPEIVENGVNGLLVEPDDPLDLSRAILKVLSDGKLADQFRQAGLRTVEKFSLENVMTCNYRVFESVLGLENSLATRHNLDDLG